MGEECAENECGVLESVELVLLEERCDELGITDDECDKEYSVELNECPIEL